MTRARHLALAAAAALLAPCSGCMFWVMGTSTSAGGTIPQEDLEAVRAGTPARDVLARLGAPTAVARHGETLRVPEFQLRKQGSRTLDSASLFARFAGSSPAPGDLVYLYESVRFVRSGSYVAYFVLQASGTTSGKTNPDQVVTQRLLLLIDGPSRVVRDVRLEVEELPQPDARRAGEEGA